MKIFVLFTISLVEIPYKMQQLKVAQFTVQFQMNLTLPAKDRMTNQTRAAEFLNANEHFPHSTSKLSFPTDNMCTNRVFP